MACCPFFSRSKYTYPNVSATFQIQQPTFSQDTREKYHAVQESLALYQVVVYLFSTPLYPDPVVEIFYFAEWQYAKRFVVKLHRILRFDSDGLLDTRKGLPVGYRIRVLYRKGGEWATYPLPGFPCGWERTNIDALTGLLLNRPLDVPLLSPQMLRKITVA